MVSGSKYIWIIFFSPECTNSFSKRPCLFTGFYIFIHWLLHLTETWLYEMLCKCSIQGRGLMCFSLKYYWLTFKLYFVLPWGDVRLLLGKSPKAVVPNPSNRVPLTLKRTCGLFDTVSNLIHIHSVNDLMS